MNNTVKGILVAIIIIGGIALVVMLVMRNSDEEESPANTQAPVEENRNEELPNSPSDSASTSEPSGNERDVAAEVTYRNGEFSPQEVTIDQGETVRFVNEGNDDMWVGSDQHPTHTEYDGTSTNEHCENGDAVGGAFDQCRVGETYTFTFEKTGEWEYHNHVNASAGGMVIVE